MFVFQASPPLKYMNSQDVLSLFPSLPQDLFIEVSRWISSVMRRACCEGLCWLGCQRPCEGAGRKRMSKGHPRWLPTFFSGNINIKIEKGVQAGEDAETNPPPNCVSRIIDGANETSCVYKVERLPATG